MKTLFFTISFLLMCTIMQCTQQIAGTGSEAEYKTVAGIVTDKNGIPSQGALIQLIELSTDSLTFSYSDLQPAVKTTATDTKGAFTIDSVVIGSYSLIAKAETLGSSVRFNVEKTDKEISLLTTVAPLGTFNFTIESPEGYDGTSAIIFTTYDTSLTVQSGLAYSIQLPSGMHEFIIIPSNQNLAKRWVRNISIKPLETLTYPTITLLLDCASQECDNAVVRRLLDKNNLHSIPVSNVAEYNKSGRIWRLELDDYAIDSMPADLYLLGSLEVLSLTRTKIENFPDDFRKCYNIKSIILKENSLVKIPEILFSLPNIQILSIRQNSLTSIPDEIGRLIALTNIDISKNFVTYLPEEMLSLPLLQHCTVSGNNLCNVSQRATTFLNEKAEEDWSASQECR